MAGGLEHFDREEFRINFLFGDVRMSVEQRATSVQVFDDVGAWFGELSEHRMTIRA